MADIEFDHHASGFKETAPPIYARLRAECPVARTETYGGFWVVSRYGDVSDVARDQETFSSARSVVIPATDVGFLPPLETDSPALDRYRKMLAPFFSATAVRAMEPRIEGHAKAAVDAFFASGRAELVTEYANPVPARTTMELLGLEHDDWRMFADPLHDASYSKPESEEFQRALVRIAEFGQYIEREVDARIDTPRDDMISGMLAAAPGGVLATRDEVIGLVRMVVFGGMDTVMAAMSNVVLRLGHDPDLRRRLIDEPGLIPRAVEEFLRLDAPIQGFSRTVMRDCALAGRKIAAGDIVFVLWASANRDPDVFDRPDDVVLDRPSNRHLTFGIGPHFCQGAGLARAELRIMLAHLLERIPEYRLIEEQVVAPVTIGIANGWVAVPVEF